MAEQKLTLGAWYDQTPGAYAESLRYSAERSEKTAERKAAEGKPWSDYESEGFRRQARRLRAMAVFCDRSSATRAGNVDFRGLQYPDTSREIEDAAIAAAEGTTDA